MQYGAMGYLPKTSADDELFDALEALMDIMFRSAEEEAPEDPRSLLTEREREVFGALIHGYTITEIAERLHLSVKTVDTHKSHIYAKLNCRRRSELVSLALQHGLLQ